MSLETRQKISETKLAAQRHHTDEHKEQVSRELRKVRAQNPEWDRKHEHICPGCGKTFVGRESQKWCTFACGKAYEYQQNKETWNKRHERICARCSKPFMGNLKSKYCSRACAGKISEADATEIRRLYSTGMRQVQIGQQFGVSQAHVSKVLLGGRR